IQMSRLCLFVFLVLVSTAFSLQCWDGHTLNGNPTDAAGKGFQPTTCDGQGTGYCYKKSEDTGNGKSVEKKCDPGACTKKGCTSTPNGKYCCCKDKDLCNGAPGASLLMTSIVAAGAAWAWH
ncbi:hypothetical protein PMAYCL1PPCAC_13651, partial [Pristionchus mayeri]